MEQSLSGPSSVFVGKKLDEHRGSFLLEYPMDKGHVVDGGWDAMESLWEVSDDDTIFRVVIAEIYLFRCTQPQSLLFLSIASLF